MNDAHRLDLQMHYWNAVGPTKSFAHPVNIPNLRRWVAPTSRILDYGCGYGRALGILKDNGYTELGVRRLTPNFSCSFLWPKTARSDSPRSR
jgi:SAM-dependent methyltransferase